MKKWLYVLWGIALIAVLAACTANSSSEEDRTEGEQADSGDTKTLMLNNGEEPTSFDPPMGFDSVSWNALNNLMEGMTRLGKDHQPEPAAAEEWEVSEDGKVYTFMIREDAKWSNGDDVTAGDFEFAWKRLLDPGNGLTGRVSRLFH